MFAKLTILRKTFFEHAIAHILRAISYVIKKSPSATDVRKAYNFKEDFF